MAPEVRAGGELRVAGRALTGLAMVYGAVSEEHRERFVAGAFSPVPAVPLLLQHDRSMVIVEPGAYELTDTDAALEVRAELPPEAAALQLVKRRALGGFSVAFRARAESRDGEIRVVEKAELVEVSLVDRPAYDASTAEVRRRGDRGGRLGTIRGRVPVDARVDCRCGPGDCLEAVFERGSMDRTIDKAEVLAVVGDYANAIASKKRGGGPLLGRARRRSGVCRRYPEHRARPGAHGDDGVGAGAGAAGDRHGRERLQHRGQGGDVQASRGEGAHHRGDGREQGLDGCGARQGWRGAAGSSRRSRCR